MGRAVATGLFAAALAVRGILLAFAHANPDTNAFLGTIAGGNRALYSRGVLFSPWWAAFFWLAWELRRLHTRAVEVVETPTLPKAA